MQIFVKGLSGNAVTLQVGTRLDIGPVREDGTFRIQTSWGVVEDAVGAFDLLEAPGKFCRVTLIKL